MLRTMFRTAPLHLALIATAGCYFYYPHHIDDLKQPKLVDGGRIEVTTSHKATTRLCLSQDEIAGRCVLVDGKWRLPAVLFEAKATYNGERLSQSEFYMLTSEGFPAAIDKIRSHKGVCRLSLVPSVIALAGAAFATVVLAAGDKIETDTAIKLIAIGGGTFAGGALLSIPLGGVACRRASNEAEQLPGGGSRLLGWSSYDEDDINAVVRLADEFNARGGRPPDQNERKDQQPDRKPPSDEPIQRKPPNNEPPHETPPVTASADSALAVLRGLKQHSKFVKVIEASGMADKLGSDAPLTIFAMTDSAFDVALGAENFAKLIADRDQSRQLVRKLVAEGTYAGPGTHNIATLDGSRLKLIVSDGAYELGKNHMSGNAIQRGKVTIYPLDAVK